MVALTVSVLGGGSALILWAYKKWGPGLTSKFLGGAIKAAINFDEGDPIKNQARKNMILANMVYLEVEMPDRGKGAERKARIISMFGEKAGPIVEECLFQLDDEMKKIAAQVPPQIPPAH
jgi:hypothetical protein